MRIIFVVLLFLFSVAESRERKLVLSGKLHKKYYEAPSIVKHPAYAWFLELDGKSRALITEQYDALSQEDRDIYEMLGINLNLVRCITRGDFLPQLRNSDQSVVSIEGFLESPWFCQKVPCFNIDCQKLESIQRRSCHIPEVTSSGMDFLSERNYEETALSREFDANEELIEKEVLFHGKLILKLFAGPPEYSSIEEGDEPDYCWLLLLEQTHEVLALCLNGEGLEFCNKHVGEQIVVNGMLFPAHTAHHPTPCLIHVKNISLRPSPSY